MNDPTKHFIQRVVAVHGTQYSYSKTHYRSAREKVVITCPVHGDFEQRAHSHLEGYGCKACAIQKTAKLKLAKRLTRACLECQVQFQVTPGEMLNGGGKFCSRACMDSFRKSDDRNCAHCGKRFTPKKTQSKYCTSACSGDARRWTTSAFIEGAEKVHGRTYGYGHSMYSGMNQPVQIDCSQHGSFQQRPADHLLGCGCQKCAAVKRGQLALQRVPVTCENCNTEFFLPPNEASRRRFCSTICAAESNVEITKDAFIEKATLVHGEYYSYLKLEFSESVSRSDARLTITCPTHGDFTQMAKVHLGGAGCNYCSGRKFDRAKFVSKSSEVHGEKFDYSLIGDIKSMSEKVVVVCPSHGPFAIYAARHLAGDGCRACAIEVRGRKNYEAARARWIPRATKIHEGRFNYSNVKYLSAKEPVEIICSEHGSYWQSPNNHLNGAGCPRCGGHGFDNDKPATLYYLRVNDGNRLLWKIGITNRDVKTRFPRDYRKITTLEFWTFELGIDAYKREQEILKQYAASRYVGAPVLLDAGNTELFIEDVLGLDGM